MDVDLDIFPNRPYLLTDADWELINYTRRQQAIRIAESQWWLCFYCVLPLDLDNLTRDHSVPRARGGKGTDANIVACCNGCNKRKGDMDAPPAGYIRLKQRQYYRELGLRSTKPRREWAKIFPGFGTGLDGEPLFAPQIGIV